jgi:NhaP-type Na+/H+ or K+/H+ antiporter
MPDDALFEVSGVLQLVVALYAARWVVRLWRERKRAEEIEESRVENVA